MRPVPQVGTQEGATAITVSTPAPEASPGGKHGSMDRKYIDRPTLQGIGKGAVEKGTWLRKGSQLLFQVRVA